MKKDILTSGCEKHELIKGEALSSSFNDSGSCGLSESKSSDDQFGDLKDSSVISDGADNDGDPVSIERMS